MATLADLTQREIQILHLVLKGQTNKAIAAELDVCEKTVEFHLNHVYTKIDVHTRLMAGIWALQQRMDSE
jgi:two-component system, NarL family, nitrate/nitrite response regulator NarL